MNTLGKKLWFFILLFISVFSFAQTVTEKFLVRGNCGMCKTRIEDIAKKSGAKTAIWTADNQTLTMTLDESQVSCVNILKSIAEAGHDNEKFKASDNAYKKLPACCLYTKENDIQNESVSPIESTDKTSRKIEEVKLIREKEATAISKKEAGLVFNINSKELLKAACCNLSESFETNATVDVSFSNAVTGTKQLKMLGLDQKYTLLTKELLPEIRGLASAYGLNFIPGKWIGGIQLTKGGSTVVNGYESITGQINTELLKMHGDEKPETEINLFSDFNGRSEMNLTHISPLNEKWNQSILLHGNGTFGDTDTNDDGFLDRPKGSQMNVTYLINYNDLEKSGLASHF